MRGCSEFGGKIQVQKLGNFIFIIIIDELKECVKTLNRIGHNYLIKHVISIQLSLPALFISSLY